MPGQLLPQDANVDNLSLITLGGAGAASATGPDQTNPYARGATIVVDITAISGSGASVTVTVEAKDPVSGKYYTLLASTALTAVGTTVLRIHPNVVAAANSAAQLPLPKTWRVRTTVAGTTPSITATIGASLHH